MVQSPSGLIQIRSTSGSGCSPTRCSSNEQRWSSPSVLAVPTAELQWCSSSEQERIWLLLQQFCQVMGSSKLPGKALLTADGFLTKQHLYIKPIISSWKNLKNITPLSSPQVENLSEKAAFPSSLSGISLTVQQAQQHWQTTGLLRTEKSFMHLVHFSVFNQISGPRAVRNPTISKLTSWLQ